MFDISLPALQGNEESPGQLEYMDCLENVEHLDQLDTICVDKVI